MNQQPVGTSLKRREFLALLGAAAACAALSACGSAAAPASPSSAPASAAAKPSTSAAAPASAAAKPAATPAPSASGAALAPLKVAYVVVAATQSALWMANEIGAFAKHGAKVDLMLLDNNVAVKSLIAKEVDVVMQSATAIINANLNGNADLVYVGSASNHPQGALYGAPNIKTPADLKGKLIGSDKPGSTTDYYTQLEFKLMGMSLSDVEVRPLGSTDVIFQALTSGQIQAGTMTPPQSFAAETKGFNVLQTTYAQDYQGNGVMVQRNRIKDLTPALLGYLAGLRDGMAAFNKDVDLAKKVMAKYGKIDDPAVLDRTYQFHTTSNPFELDLKPTLTGIQAMLDFLSKDLPAAKNAKPEQFVDLSLVNQLPPLSS
jgi:ABC-type nitrate/sulfonate/bicarbonate transport system substrate-binding protein